MKNKKAPEQDGLTVELLKDLPETWLVELTGISKCDCR